MRYHMWTRRLQAFLEHVMSSRIFATLFTLLMLLACCAPAWADSGTIGFDVALGEFGQQAPDEAGNDAGPDVDAADGADGQEVGPGAGPGVGPGDEHYFHSPNRTQFLFRGIIGGKAMSSSDWSPTVGVRDSYSELEDQWAIGLDLEWRPFELPIGLVFAYHHSGGYQIQEVFMPGPGTFDVDFDLHTDEIQLGLRWTFDFDVPGAFLPPQPLHLYIQGGVTFAWADLEYDSAPFGRISDSDNGQGIWFGGGVNFDLMDYLTVGIDIKYSDAVVEILGVQRNAGGLYFGLTVGIRF